MKRQPAPLDYKTAAHYFTRIDVAKGNLEGTIALVSTLVNEEWQYDDLVFLTIRRHLVADLDQLNAAFDAAHKAICAPLHAVAHPNDYQSGDDQ